MRSNRNVAFDCKFHVVWCPKYRRKVLVNGVDKRLKKIAAEVCKERDVRLLEIEVMPDHVHILVEADPQFGIHRLVSAKSFLGYAADCRHCWTNSYYVSTVGGAPLATIKRYIENQKDV